MKINLLICSLLAGIIAMSSVVFLLVKEQLIVNKSLSYESNIVNNDEVRIKKIEKSDKITYVVDDQERDLIYTWSFDKDIDESLNISEDLRLQIDQMTGDASKIEEVVKNKKVIISFDYHGILPDDAVVRLKVNNKFKDGENLYLYYYNPEKDQIEFIDNYLTVRDGYVEFSIEHCSDYFLTATVVQDAVNNPKNINYVIIGLVVVAFILVVVTLGQSKK